MYVKLYKGMLKNKRLNSDKVFFPTILYLMLVNNYYKTSYFSIGNILDYFHLPRTTRNFNDIYNCLESISAEGYIRQVYGICNEIKMNDLIGYEIIANDEFFVQVQDFEIDKIIEIYENKEPNYMFAIIFLLLKVHSFASDEIVDGKIIEYVKISYSTLMRSCEIKSNTTMTKYTKLLEEFGMVEIDKDLDIEDYTDDTGKTKQMFKTTHTYYFKERDK